ncbi:MAG TPA: hypothetical protein VGO86_13055 [Candidatus Dormibacteraeota bacterium]|jgi:hypothetical protein
MNRAKWLIVGVLAAGAVLTGCGTPAESAPEKPARVVPVQGTSLSRVVLTPKAAERVGLMTAPVQTLSTPGAGPASSTVPLAAVVYLADGTTWVYTVPEPLTYVRQSVTIAGVAGDVAVLKAGPAPGTQVVTVGAAELLGSEYGVAGGQ